MTTTLAIGAVVVDAAGRVLVVRRANPPLQGAWTILGGKPIAGESLDDAVRREVREEAALTVDVVGLVEIVTIAREGYRYEVHEFLCTVHPSSGPLVAGDDAVDARFVDEGELEGLGVLAAARAVVARGLALLGAGRLAGAI